MKLISTFMIAVMASVAQASTPPNLQSAKEIECHSYATGYDYTFYLEFGEVYVKDYHENEVVSGDGFQNRVKVESNGAVEIEMIHHETPDTVDFRLRQESKGAKITGFAALSLYSSREKDDRGLECEITL